MITANMEGLRDYIDDAVRIKDHDAIRMVFRLLHEEGVFVGGSAGLNVLPHPTFSLSVYIFIYIYINIYICILYI